MPKKKQLYACGIGPAFEVIGGKWRAVILWELQLRPLRFGELKRAIPGITEKMLIQQLRELEGDGLVDRKVQTVVPPHVEYSTTALGRSLNTALAPLADWGEAFAKRRSKR